MSRREGVARNEDVISGESAKNESPKSPFLTLPVPTTLHESLISYGVNRSKCCFSQSRFMDVLLAQPPTGPPLPERGVPCPFMLRLK